MEQMQTITTNALLAIAIVTIGAVETAALLTGHNGDYFNLALGLIVGLAGGVPTAQGFFQNRRSGLHATESQPVFDLRSTVSSQTRTDSQSTSSQSQSDKASASQL